MIMVNKYFEKLLTDRGVMWGVIMRYTVVTVQ